MSKWKKLCKYLKREYKTESELEGVFEICLDFLLGWSDNNILKQMGFQFGHETKRADLVIVDDDKQPIIVIEMKKQGVPVTEHEILQLSSYMRLEKIAFGLLVSDRVSFYYDPASNRDKLIRVLNLSFNDVDNSDGEDLFALLDKEAFSVDRMKEFCEDYLQRKNTLEKELGTGIIVDNISNYRSINVDLDKKINQLIALYSEWLSMDNSSNQREREYLLNLEQNRKWIKEKIISADLARINETEYISLFKDFIGRIPNMTRFLRMGINSDAKILEIRESFEMAVTYLASVAKKDRFTILNDFIENGKYKVPHLDRSFWSEMIRIKFPDVPLLNQKTERFFDAIGVYIGDTQEEKLRNVSSLYTRFSNSKMSLDMLSHLEHFAMARNIKNEKGIRFLQKNFPNYMRYHDAE